MTGPTKGDVERELEQIKFASEPDSPPLKVCEWFMEREVVDEEAGIVRVKKTGDLRSIEEYPFDE